MTWARTDDEALRPLPALQATLGAEHAAAHVYAALGGRVRADDDPTTAARLRAAYEVHRARRDQLRSIIADLGKVPVAAEAGYRVDADGRASAELLRVARVTAVGSAVVALLGAVIWRRSR